MCYVVDLGWADFDFCVPPFCPAAQPPLPNYHQAEQSRADGGTLEIQVNKTQSTSTWDALYIRIYTNIFNTQTVTTSA